MKALAFRFTCPDCPKSDKGWADPAGLTDHLTAEHADRWTAQQVRWEVVEQSRMAEEVAR